MNNSLTEIVFILDRSGSMQTLTDDTIGGFNSFIEKQKQEPGDAILTTVLFDDQYEVLHDGVNLKDVKPLTREDYYARGMTAMMDAIGRTINTVDAGAIPDVSLSDEYGKAVYAFYRAGVLVGSDGGFFHPDSSIRRSEVAAILARLYDPAQRLSITLRAPDGTVQPEAPETPTPM